MVLMAEAHGGDPRLVAFMQYLRVAFVATGASLVAAFVFNAELLFKTFRDATEGELSVRFNQLVSAEACASVADEMELHRFIRTGSDVKKITAKNMLNVRADVVESLIAAIYLEAGLEAARGFILKYWTSRAARADGGSRR